MYNHNQCILKFTSQEIHILKSIFKISINPHLSKISFKRTNPGKYLTHFIYIYTYNEHIICIIVVLFSDIFVTLLQFWYFGVNGWLGGGGAISNTLCLSVHPSLNEHMKFYQDHHRLWSRHFFIKQKCIFCITNMKNCLFNCF